MKSFLAVLAFLLFFITPSSIRAQATEPASMPAANDAAADQLRQQFIDAYRALDTDRCDAIVAQARAQNPMPAVASQLQFQLALLYAYAVRPPELYEFRKEYDKGTALLRDFMPDGALGKSPEAAEAQLEYAGLLLRGGQKSHSFALYKNLMDNADPFVARDALLELDGYMDTPDAEAPDWMDRAYALLNGPAAAASPQAFQMLKDRYLDLYAHLKNPRNDDLAYLRDQILCLSSQINYSQSEWYDKANDNLCKPIEKLGLEYQQKLAAATPAERAAESPDWQFMVLTNLGLVEGLSHAEQSKAIFDELARRKDEVSPKRRAVLGVVLSWQMYYAYGNEPNFTAEERDLQMMCSGLCGPYVFADYVVGLRDLLVRKGDKAEAWRTLRDAWQEMPYAPLGLQLKHRFDVFVRENPEFANQQDSRKSKLDRYMAAAGQVQSRNGKALFTVPPPFGAVTDFRMPTYDWTEK